MVAALVSESFFEDDNENISIEMDEVFEGLPVGYRFIPQDHELISGYLMNKIMGFQLPFNVIKDVDFHNLDPFQFSVGDFKHGRKMNEAYYFIETNSIYSMKTDRTTNNGYWKARGTAKEIKHDGRIVGLKTIFVFYWRDREIGDDSKSSWVMHEFRIHPAVFSADQLLDDKMIKAKMEQCVICRIVKKDGF